jgi:heme oxygenase-like protein
MTPSRAASMTKGSNLRTRVALMSDLLGAGGEAMLARPDLARSDLSRIVTTHLVMLHQITRASVPLMEAAQVEAHRRRGDRICRALAAYLEGHIEEERQHDEWTLDDLAAAGIGREQVLAALPSANVAALVGAPYYWILHHHPVALLGYIAVLEYNAPSEFQVDQLQAKTGLPEPVFRTHRLHAALDPGHVTALFDLVDRLDLDAELERLVAASATHTSAKLADCLAELLLANDI